MSYESYTEKTVISIWDTIVEVNADAMLLGCTEIPLAIKPGDVSVPTLNSTEIHIKEIYEKAK